MDKTNWTKILISLFLKFLILATLTFIASEVLVYALKHVQRSTYVEPLSSEQILLRDIFLTDKESPGVITELEKLIIAEQKRTETKIFGIAVKGISIYKLNTFLMLFSATSITIFATGWLISVSARNNLKYWEAQTYLMFIVLGIGLAELWRAHGLQIAQIAFALFGASLVLGFMNWPLWALIDKIFGRPTLP